MARSNPVKLVNVQWNPRTSLKEAGIYKLKLESGARVLAIANLFFPHHDRELVELIQRFIKDSRPELIIMLGGMFDPEAFVSLWTNKQTYLHQYEDAPEVASAREEAGFEDKILRLARSCGEFLKSFSEIACSKVFYIPSTTTLGMSSEVQLMDWIQTEKKRRDQISERGKQVLSDPQTSIPRQFTKLFGLEQNPMVGILQINSGVLLNDDTLFIVGDFKRKHTVAAALEDVELRGYSIVRGAGGKLGSAWFTSALSSLPSLQFRFNQVHEVGKAYFDFRMGQFGDYERRAPGFFWGEVVGETLFGRTVPVIRGRDGRRSFMLDGIVYVEDEPGGLPRSRDLTLAPYTNCG